jgi:hypothetical protein
VEQGEQIAGGNAGDERSEYAGQLLSDVGEFVHVVLVSSPARDDCAAEREKSQSFL